MASPILGPITKVPYDILAEIFVHCLPQHRLEHRQPNTAIAPILLCHVCSTWRTVALETATLWTHLSYRLTFHKECNEYDEFSWILRKNEHAFLLWWKNNQHSMAPSLCLDLAWRDRWNWNTISTEPDPDAEVNFDGEGMMFLFDYVSSAKYLETKEFFWFLIGNRIERGDSIVYPVPQTLVVTNWMEHFDSFYQDQIALVPNHSPSALRRLYLTGDIHVHIFDFPPHWSSLTHLALLVATMSLDYWYALIRANPYLELGHFEIEVLDDDDHTKPALCTLAHLSTLSVSVDITNDNVEFKFPLAMLLTGLHLPALRDLSLSSGEEWSDHRALSHIYAVLDAVPTITTLTLGPSFLTLQKDEEYLMQTLPQIKDTAPVWRHAPHLAHLRLVAEGPPGRFQQDAEERRDAFVRNLFHPDSCWLDLNNTACPIQSVTIIDRQPSEHRAKDIADYTWSRIREYAGGSPDVKAVFDVIFETQDQAVAGAWNEWGPNLQ